MRLISLSANQATFRAITFNRTGLSLIVAEQRTPRSNNTSTYNGVGKSLLLELLHCCMGAQVNKNVQPHLREWEFYLSVDVEGSEHTIARSFEDPSKVRIDGDELSLTRYKEWLTLACFDTKANAKHISFRGLI